MLAGGALATDLNHPDAETTSSRYETADVIIKQVGGLAAAFETIRGARVDTGVRK